MGLCDELVSGIVHPHLNEWDQQVTMAAGCCVLTLSAPSHLRRKCQPVVLTLPGGGYIGKTPSVRNGDSVTAHFDVNLPVAWELCSKSTGEIEA